MRALFCVLLLSSLAIAQTEDRKKVLDNFDLAPEIPASEVVEKPKYAVKSSIKKSIKRESKSEEYKELKIVDVQQSAQPKIYAQLNSSIDDFGRIVLTSETIIVQPLPTGSSPMGTTDTTGSSELDELILKAAKKYNVDPRLILEVMRQESGFRRTALSPKGAQGLMQLIPATATRFGVYRPYDPQENIFGGTRYLRFLLDKFKGNVELALAGYNAGENAVIRYGFTIPPYRETRDYVRSILARYRSKYHQITNAQPEQPAARTAPLMIFAAEDGRAILSNNY
ncbi:MAG: lytic transglycosylase domain-containing protein [Acidobacteriota bacterium]|nr:lytic transglycosylase domain-containing protein [Blastocatellia bacterium]MDW8411652.1 lytic transglycosylase domain-containing protein [Acidobacteriota bacterium]